jgi:hypothetical protein
MEATQAIAIQVFGDERNSNSPRGRFVSEVSKSKHQLD